MGIDAVALLHLDRPTLGEHLAEAGEMDGMVILTNPLGAPIAASFVGDAALVHTGLRFLAQPAMLGPQLRSVLGPALDAHPDERGVYVFPDVARVSGEGYAELLDELGEGGMWIGRAELAGQVDLATVAHNLQRSLSPDAIEQIRQLVGAPPAAGAPPGMPDVAAILEMDGVGDMLVDAARKLTAQLGPGAMPELSPELVEQARATAERLMANDPSRFAELASRFQAAAAVDDDDDDDG